MSTFSLPYNWAPREYQQSTWDALSKLNDPANKVKSVGICCHRRWGKDEVMLHHNCCSAFERVGNYWYMLPEYSQARKAMWNAINPHTGKRRIDEAFPEFLRKKTLENEMFIEFKNGSTWQLMGSDNYDSLVGAPPIGVTFSEFSISNPNSFEYLSPIMMENGGWRIVNGTPRGKNHFYHTLEYGKNEPDWFTLVSTVADTDVFDDEQLQSELRRLQKIHGNDYGRAIWLQEYYCSFDAAIPGAIWADSLIVIMNEERIKSVKADIRYPVHTGWDLGFSDDTVIWFYQIIDKKIKVLYYYADNFKDVEFYANKLHSLAVENNWKYGLHWLPHDGVSKTMAGGGKSIIQQLYLLRDKLKGQKGFSLGEFRRAPKLSKEDGIQAARATFPYCDFDLGTSDGFELLKSYHRKYDEEKKTFSNTPVHDKSSHTADAWITVSTTWAESKKEQVVIPFSDRIMEENVSNITFGAFKKAHFDRKRAEMVSKL